MAASFGQFAVGALRGLGLVLLVAGCQVPVNLESKLEPAPAALPATRSISSCEQLKMRLAEYSISGLERDARQMAEQLASCTRREYRENPADVWKFEAYEDARWDLIDLYLRNQDYARAERVALDLLNGPERCERRCEAVTELLIDSYARQKRYGEMVPLLEERLARLRGAGAEARQMAGAEMQMAEALTGTRQFQRALENAERALARLENAGIRGETELRARLLLLCGRNQVQLGRFSEANRNHDLARVTIQENPRGFRSIFRQDIENVRNYYHRSRDFGRAQQFDELLQAVGG